MGRKIAVIVNPIAGQPQPVISTLNSVFAPLEVEWNIFITKGNGDAERFAREAVESGVDVVAAYGGDGTVMEVTSSLLGSQVPVAILPGGTANLLATELNIPKDLAQAAALAADPNSCVRLIDAGLFGENAHFVLRVGIGFAARKVEIADREMKDRWGLMAYSIAALKALGDSQIAHYSLTLDGSSFETDGFFCMVDNAGNIGLTGLGLQSIVVDDGLLDVIIVRDASIRSWIAMGASISGIGYNPEYILHLQAKEISIQADPPQLVERDGELAGETPIQIRVAPGAVRFLTPP